MEDDDLYSRQGSPTAVKRLLKGIYNLYINIILLTHAYILHVCIPQVAYDTPKHLFIFVLCLQIGRT